MRKLISFGILVSLVLSGLAIAEEKVTELTGEEILDRVETMNDAKDQKSTMKMILIDSRGKKNIREAVMWIKGDYKRLIKFLSPADIKGTGFLVLNADLPDEKLYLYLPAFKKIRRIATHAKGGSFMGSDFTYDDISSTGYAKDYTVKRLKDKKGQYVLELTKKPESDKDYDRLIMTVSKECFVPTRVEYYKEKKVKEKIEYRLRKVMTMSDIKKIKKYWVPQEIEMEDIQKKHKTRMELYDIVLDSGLSDDLFTERNLQR